MPFAQDHLSEAQPVYKVLDEWTAGLLLVGAEGIIIDTDFHPLDPVEGKNNPQGA